MAIFYLAPEPTCKGLGHQGVKGPLHGCNEVLLRIAQSTETVIKAWEKVEGDIRISGRYQGGLQLLGNGMGNVRAAAATQQAIAVWNPAQILLTGIAGGIEKPNNRLLGAQ